MDTQDPTTQATTTSPTPDPTPGPDPTPPLAEPAPPTPARRSGGRRWLMPALLLVIACAACAWYALSPRFSGRTVNASNPRPADLVLDDVHATLNAAGASFPYPFYSKLFAQYNGLRPGVRINYASVGSGAGIRQFSDLSIDFGASDAPMSDQQMSQAKGGQVLHVPMTVGAVVPIYNLPGVDPAKSLVFSGPVLADVFRGQITRWNDPAIAALNPGAGLPDTEITIVHRADGSGTTYVFTDYLCKVSPPFAAETGKGTTVNWRAPNKVGGKGSEAVAGIVSKTPGTLGYVELTFALQNRIAFGSVINRAGRAVHATLQSVTTAADSLPTPPPDLRMSITDAPGDDAYPIAAFSYLLIYRHQTDRAKANALADFLTWAVTDGQRLAPDLHYAPLPSDITALDQKLIQTLQVNGRHFASAQ
jgi:phosphate transport system substrate-binding protein